MTTKRIALSAAISLCLLLSLPALAGATTRYVAVGGANSGNCSNPGSPCSLPSYAVGQSSSGDTIQVGPGNYLDHVTVSQSVNIVGAGSSAVTISPPPGLVYTPADENFNYAIFTVPAGVTLTIEPGTSLYFGAGMNISVGGTLLAQGTETRHIRFTRPPGTTTTWAGLAFDESDGMNRISYADLEFALAQRRAMGRTCPALKGEHTWELRITA